MSSSRLGGRLIFSSLFTFLCFSSPALSYRPTYLGTFSNPTFFRNVKVTDTELNKICSQTEDPSYCLNAFKHDQQTPKADFNQLCGIGLKLATFVSSNAKSQAQSYAQNEKDPQLKTNYQSCVANYDNILGRFDEAGKSLTSGKFGDVKSAASEASTDAAQCFRLFGVETVVGGQSRQSETLAQAVVAIVNKLS